jgi:hypothetical protein
MLFLKIAYILKKIYTMMKRIRSGTMKIDFMASETKNKLNKLFISTIIE